MYELLTLFTGFVFLYSITAGGIARTPISGAIVFTLFGWLVGPAGFDLLNLPPTAEGLRTLAELTLALVLFTDAANANLAVLRRSIGLPQRLLLLGLVTWVIFGALVLGHLQEAFRWEIAVYAVASLTVIRMLPVFVALSGSGLSTDEKLFASWFGPRGMASIVFAVIVLDEALPNGGILVQTVVATIVLSILCHGLSANPLITLLAERLQKRKG